MKKMVQMAGKTDKQFLFEVQLIWLEGSSGILSAKDAGGSITVATSTPFGGEGNQWTPEYLFLSAISSCFMTTYLAFAKKLRFEIADFRCDAIGQIEIIKRKYKFTHINLYPIVYIAEERLRTRASLALKKTHRHCLVANSVNAIIFYHSQILVAAGARHEVADTTGLNAVFSTAKVQSFTNNTS